MSPFLGQHVCYDTIGGLADAKLCLTVMLRTLWKLSRMKILNNKLSALDTIKESGVIAYGKIQ